MKNSELASAFKDALDKQDYKAAFQSMKTSISSHPLEISDLLQLSEVQSERNKLDSALQLANRAIQLAENNHAASRSTDSVSPKLTDCYKQKCMIYFQWKMYSEAYEQIVLAAHLLSAPNTSLDHYRTMVETIYKMDQSKDDPQLKSEEQKYIEDYELMKDLAKIISSPQDSEIPASYKQKAVPNDKKQVLENGTKKAAVPVSPPPVVNTPEHEVKKPVVTQTETPPKSSPLKYTPTPSPVTKGVKKVAQPATSLPKTSVASTFASVGFDKIPPVAASTSDDISETRTSNFALSGITPRSDWYESANQANISLFVKNIAKNSIVKEFKESSVKVEFNDNKGLVYQYSIEPLFGKINTLESNISFTALKAEIVLMKVDVGRWNQLIKDQSPSEQAQKKSIPIMATKVTPTTKNPIKLAPAPVTKASSAPVREPATTPDSKRPPEFKVDIDDEFQMVTITIFKKDIIEESVKMDARVKDLDITFKTKDGNEFKYEVKFFAKTEPKEAGFNVEENELMIVVFKEDNCFWPSLKSTSYFKDDKRKFVTFDLVGDVPAPAPKPKLTPASAPTPTAKSKPQGTPTSKTIVSSESKIEEFDDSSVNDGSDDYDSAFDSDDSDDDDKKNENNNNTKNDKDYKNGKGGNGGNDNSNIKNNNNNSKNYEKSKRGEDSDSDVGGDCDYYDSDSYESCDSWDDDEEDKENYEGGGCTYESCPFCELSKKDPVEMSRLIKQIKSDPNFVHSMSIPLSLVTMLDDSDFHEEEIADAFRKHQNTNNDKRPDGSQKGAVKKTRDRNELLKELEREASLKANELQTAKAAKIAGAEKAKQAEEKRKKKKVAAVKKAITAEKKKSILYRPKENPLRSIPDGKEEEAKENKIGPNEAAKMQYYVDSLLGANLDEANGSNFNIFDKVNGFDEDDDRTSSRLTVAKQQEEPLPKEIASLHPDTMIMCELFPGIPLSYISDSLKENNGDKELVSEVLLNYDLLKDDKGSALFELPKKKQRKKQNSSDAKDKEVLKAISILNDIEEIMELLNINGKDQRLVEFYYERNNKIKNRAIVDILQNFEPSLRIENQPRINYSSLTLSLDNSAPSSSSSSSTPSIGSLGSGRVQGGYAGSSNGAKIQSSYADVISASAKSKSSSLQLQVQQTYSQQISELKDYLSSNKELRKLKDSFYISALKFFKGDLGCVLQVASRLAEETSKIKLMNPNLVFTDGDILEDELRVDKFATVEKLVKTKAGPDKSYDELMEEVEHLRKQAKAQTDRTVRQVYHERAKEKYQVAREILDDANDEEVNARLAQAKYNNRLDLHELSVQLAFSTAKQALIHWWEEEIIYREHNCIDLKGTKARGGELHIITGRGIHSAGGISKIKTSVGKLLKESGYIYTDNGSSYTVTGKYRYVK